MDSLETKESWKDHDVISSGMKISLDLPVVDSLDGAIHVVQLDPADNIVLEDITEEYNIVQLDSDDNQLNLTELKPQDDNMVTLWHVNSDFEIENEAGVTYQQVEVVSNISVADFSPSVVEGSTILDTSQFPPPPEFGDCPEHHTILKQRNTRKGQTRLKLDGHRTGANRFDDLEKRESYKRTACDRERNRMRDMNMSFEQLRKRVPYCRKKGKRTSKIESLHMAIKYIKHLKYLLSFPPGQHIPKQIIQFDPSQEAWKKLGHREGPPLDTSNEEYIYFDDNFDQDPF